MKKISVLISVLFCAALSFGQASFQPPIVTAGATTAISWTGGTVNNGGHPVTVAAGSSTVTLNKADCSAPSFANCNFVIANSSGTVSVTTTLATAIASGNSLLALIETGAVTTTQVVYPWQSGTMWLQAAGPNTALGAATATTINGITITTGTGTLTITGTKTVTFNSTSTFTGTDSQTYTFPTTSATLARTDAANTFTGHQTIEGVTSAGATGTVNLVFSTSPTITSAVLVTPALGVASATSVTSTGVMSGGTFASATNCAATGTSANPSVASCGSAVSGSFSCATAATGGTCQINTTGVTANSVILVTEDDGLGAKLSVTCNTGTTVLPTHMISTRSAGASFTINLGTVTTNPACFNYWIIN